MEGIKPLSDFFTAIAKDGRISTTHIGVYAALLQYWQEHACINPVQVYSHEMMRIAKISAKATYFKIVQDLHLFGYLRYEPSYKRNCPSRVYLPV